MFDLSDFFHSIFELFAEEFTAVMSSFSKSFPLLCSFLTNRNLGWVFGSEVKMPASHIGVLRSHFQQVTAGDG